MNKRKFFKLGWLGVPFLISFLASSRAFGAINPDNMDSTTSQRREVYMGPLGEVQTFNVSTENGGQVAVGAGTSTSGFVTYFSSPTRSQIININGMNQFNSGVIYSSTGTIITTTTFQGVLQVSTITAATSNAYGTITIPANSLLPGKIFRYTVNGIMSTPGLANTFPVLTSVKLGTTTVATTGNIIYPVGLSSMSYSLNGTLSIVSSGTFVGGISSATANFMITVASGTTQSPAGAFIIGNSTTNVAQINTTQANDLNIVIGFGSSGWVLGPTAILYERMN